MLNVQLPDNTQSSTKGSLFSNGSFLMTQKLSKLKVCQSLLVTLLGVGALSHHAQAEEVSFKGERVEFVMPYKEGGGTDTWGRFYAPYLSQSLPGNPVVVVKNIPGGGSTKGANQFARRAKDNGLNIFASSASTQYPYLLQDRRVRYDYNDWSVILASPTGGVVYVSPKTGIENVQDLFDKKDQIKFQYASQGATSIDLVPLLAMDLLGLDVQAIFGMQGRGAGRLAFERGEVNIDSQTSSSYIDKVTPLVNEGKAIPLFSFGVLGEDGKLKRDPNFPELPHFAEVYQLFHPEEAETQGYAVWRSFFMAGFAAQKMIFVPKSTPEEIVAAWRASASELVSQPDFQKRAVEVLGDYPQLTGEQAQLALKAAMSLDESNLEWVRNWLTTNYNTRF
ncbi:Bug family tripartite tricarboxylate transporter substrate binding protein [Vibrio lentus]|uniref:Bug family tripartite tricarboxylate transporter substrate binding protein n=1 Tax=Vibrio lentus TaxID=136468 RepID=UPI001E34FDDC|nr:tripartite tricarboxylate transporter substrate-binding protein [Vibrio lentus]MCC4783001.1 tricarboxylate transporter [Vibrio lentus]MCC4857502.1 tricarboxylate transporter [Vibrio lentus]